MSAHIQQRIGVSKGSVRRTTGINFKQRYVPDVHPDRVEDRPQPATLWTLLTTRSMSDQGSVEDQLAALRCRDESDVHGGRRQAVVQPR